MTNPHGEWTWFELSTSDPDAAQGFYREVVGWTAADSGTPGMDYRLLSAADGEVAGLMPLPEGMTEPGWTGYIGVDDVDASANAIEAAGGTVHMPPATLPGVGRMSMLTDPQGVAFYVMRGESAQAGTAFRQCREFADTGSIGHAVWCELSAPDPDAALDFYRGVFGWRQEGGIPMGELGEYRFLQAGETGFGAVMGLALGDGKGWLFYFHVPDIDAAAKQVGESGGTVVHGPMEIPGGGWSLAARDPQGAHFGLVGPRK